MKTQYSYNKKVEYDFYAAIAYLKEELKKEGFGILCEIDVSAKIKEKLNEDMDRYVILGACNPKLAYEALQVEQEIGLLLPCNVIVYEKDEKVVVSAILPSKGMSFIDNPKLKQVASKVEPKLMSVIDNL